MSYMKINRAKLKMYREKLGVSQLELAEKSNVSVVTINKLETLETADPYPSTVTKICKALGIHNEDLIDKTVENDVDLKQDDLSSLLSERAEYVKYLYQIDSKMFSFIEKQMETFKCALGKVYGIEDHELFEAAIFSGMSFATRGDTTNRTNYAKVLGDLLALQNKGPRDKIIEKDGFVDLDNLDKYNGLQCVYGLYTKERLIRIGSTTNLKRRINEHINSLKSNCDLKIAKKLIHDDDPMNETFNFGILAKTPGDLKSGLQRQFFLSYAETMLIIKYETYKLANDKSICGDSYIPNNYSIEMMNYYYNKDGNQ